MINENEYITLVVVVSDHIYPPAYMGREHSISSEIIYIIFMLQKCPMQKSFQGLPQEVPQ